MNPRLLGTSTIILLGLQLLLIGCQCSDQGGESSSGGGANPSTVQGAGSTTTSSPPSNTAGSTSQAGADPAAAPHEAQFVARLNRLTPEQYSRQIATALEFTWLNNSNDAIVVDYGVALGGVDFDRSFKRDPSTKAQTLLVSRAIAWSIARQVVVRDAAQGATPVIFKLCDIRGDRPSGATASNWHAQLEDLYWRILSRAPSSDEISAAEAIYTDVMTRENSSPNGWIAILFGLLASLEAWHA